MASIKVIQTLIRKHRKKYLSIYLSPFMILVMINIFQIWIDSNFTWENSNPPEYTLNKIPKCYGEGCLTLGYIVSGSEDSYINSVLKHIKHKNSLEDADVQKLNVSKQEVLSHLSKHPNKTQSILIFCTDSHWTINKTKIPCFADEYHLNFYTILFNVSLNHRSPFLGNLKQSYPKDLVTMKLKQDVDEAIIKHHTNNSAQLTASFADYPNRTSRFIEGISIFSNFGSFFLLIPFLVLIVLQSQHLLHQKQKRLRIGLNIVGVTHLEYYLGEILTYAASVAIISVCFCASGFILRVNYFVNSIWWFNFGHLFINGLVLGLVSFNTMALVNSKSMGMSLTYGFLLYSISMQWIFSSGFVLQLLYLDSATDLMKAVKVFFNLYPSFHFSKIFTDIVRKSDFHINSYENRYIEGKGFYFQDLFQQDQQHFQQPFPHSYIMPSPLQSFIYMILTSIIYIVALWLLDNFVQSNRGYHSQLWRHRTRKQSFYQIMSDEEESFVIIKNLQKTYDNQVFALRGISMELKAGEIVGLLGQNGAGKSTLINILIGALSKSSGEVKIDGKNIEQNIVSIRKIIGVCPQFDILWEELTASQHVQMFSQLKGFPSTEQDVKKCLQSVTLYDNRNGKISTFSGGMRRRLSLSISLIGEPKLIILDEPTTGMDAHIRLLTWKLILQIRGDRTFLITTHNMEEAECLSDTIQIMSRGKIIVQGNSIDLKKKYGHGYIIKGLKNGEQVSFKCSEQELSIALERISKENFENWSLRETTLEQVFLNVNQKY